MIFNILKKAPIIDFPLQQREQTPETIYIMADETFIPLQSCNEKGEAEKKMVKAAVVFEGLENIAPTKQKPRNKLTNRHLFLSGVVSAYDKDCSIVLGLTWHSLGYFKTQ